MRRPLETIFMHDFFQDPLSKGISSLDCCILFIDYFYGFHKYVTSFYFYAFTHFTLHLLCIHVYMYIYIYTHG